MKKYATLLCFIVLISCTAKAEIKYVEINDLSNISEIEFTSLSDYEKFAVGDLFYCPKTSKIYVLVGSTYYSYNLHGYKTIADSKAGKEYKTPTDYYESMAQKIPDAERFYFFKNNSFKNGEDALDAFANGYNEKLAGGNYAKFEDENIYLDSPISVSYYKAKELGINTFSKYVEHLFLKKHGFESMDVYEIAKAKGFKENSDYKTATENGFATKAGWDKAKSYNLETQSEFNQYELFTGEIDKTVTEKEFTKREAVVYHYLKTSPKGGISLVKLNENLKIQMDSENSKVKAAVEKYVSGEYTKDGSKPVQQNGGQSANSRYSKPYYSTPRMENYVSDSTILKILEKSRELGKYNEKTDVFNKR